MAQLLKPKCCEVTGGTNDHKKRNLRDNLKDLAITLLKKNLFINYY